MKPSEIHVLLWSFSQGCFHFETLDRTMEIGCTAYADNNSHQDYIVLGVSLTRKELDELRAKLVDQFGRPPPVI